jgi:hypothetical protein
MTWTGTTSIGMKKPCEWRIGKVRIAELYGADHYVYFTHEAAVLRELTKFVADLR